MNLREFVIKEYQATVRNHASVPKALKEALATHERVPRFMDQLCAQLRNPAFKNHSNNDLRKIIQDATNFFLALIQRKAEEQAMSDIEKATVRQRVSDQNVIDKAVDSGIIDEEVIDVLKRQGDPRLKRESKD